MPARNPRPTIVVLLAPPNSGSLSERIAAAARAELPQAVPACAFEFATAPDVAMHFTVAPLAGTAGTSIEAPGRLFARPPTAGELEEARAALGAIIARVRASKLS